MTRSYIRVIPDLYSRKALGICTTPECQRPHRPYPPEALGAFIGVLCLAEYQTPRGTFPSAKVLAALLEGGGGQGEAYSRWVPFLVEEHDLVPQPDGSLVVEGWAELQEGDWQVTERMRRYRNRKNPQPAQAPDDPTGDPAMAYQQVTGRFPTDKAIKWIDDLTAQYGREQTYRAIATASLAGTEKLLGRATDALRAHARRAEQQEREQERERLREKRAPVAGWRDQFRKAIAERYGE